MEVLKQEFRWSRFSLNTKGQFDIFNPQWSCCCRLLFPCYRTALVIYTVIWFIYSFSQLWQFHNLFIFLTNWTYFFLAVYLLIYCCVCWVDFAQRIRNEEEESEPSDGHMTCSCPIRCMEESHDHSEPTNEKQAQEQVHLKDREKDRLDHEGTNFIYKPQNFKPSNQDGGDVPHIQRDVETSWCPFSISNISSALWLLFLIVFNANIIITAFYWSLIYPQGWIPLPIDINIHLINCVIITIDFFICTFPIRLAHMIYSQMYGLIYLIFTLIYWGFDPQNNVIYPIVLDWGYPVLPVCLTLGLLFVVTPLVQLVMFAMYRLKLYIASKV